MDGIVIGIDPVALQLGALQIRWYSIFVLLALAAGTAVGVKTCARKGISSDVVYSMVLWIALGGIVGGRVFHILDHLGFYLQNPRMMLGFEGLAIWGSLIGGGIALAIYARVKRIAIRPLLDAAAPAALAGQIVGRFACIINGDAYGGPTTLPWGFIYTSPNAMIPDYMKGIPTHPYPVYEQIWNLLTLALVLVMGRRLKTPGTLFLVYVSAYAVGRFLLTFFRQETVLFWGLQEAQIVSLILLIMAIPLLAWALRKDRALAVSVDGAA